MTTTRKITIALLVAMLCVSLITVTAITFSGNAATVVDGIETIAETVAVERHDHTWKHEDATPIAATGGTLQGGSSEQAAKHYYLNGNVTLTTDITVSSGYVDLCLNGYVLTGTGSTTGSFGEVKNRVITVNGGASFILYDCCEGDSCQTQAHHHNYSVGSNGSYNFSGNTGTVHGGVITGGKASGVDVRSATFTMYGGTIAGNTTENLNAGGRGAGVYLLEATFTMYGGAIQGNHADIDGGGVEVTNSNFTLHNGLIANNTATQSGGGVHLYGTTSNFTMNNGEISHNTSQSGGGVHAAATFTMKGGKITGNTATTGGGAYCYNLKISGKPYIAGNTSNNLYLASEKYIKVEGALEEGAQIGVTLADSIGAFTTGWKESYGDSTQFFSADSNDQAVLLRDGEAHIINIHMHGGDRFIELLDADTTLTEGRWFIYKAELQGNLIIDGNVELCLNGHKLTGTGNVITINQGAKLTICDCKGGGSISGSGGSNVLVNGALTMTGGKITGNTVGVNISGNASFTASNVTITDNTTGVAIAGDSSFTMNSCTISGATTGVTVAQGCTFTMTGGTITGNTTGIDVSGTFSLSSAAGITGNTSKDVILAKDCSITLTGAPKGGAQIVVELKGTTGVFATGWANSFGNVKNLFKLVNSTTCAGAFDDTLVAAVHVINSRRFDTVNHWYICENCLEEDNHVGHRWSEWKTSDLNYHEHYCLDDCGLEPQKERHTFDDTVVNFPERNQHYATCTIESCGYTGYSDHVWGAWYDKDENNHERACDTGCGATQTATHTYDEIYFKDGSQHYQVCSADDCTRRKYSAHSLKWVTTDDTEHWRECDKEGCDYEIGRAAHVYDEEFVNDGSQHYQMCTTPACFHKKYFDHNLDWAKDDTAHWNRCTSVGCTYATGRLEHVYENEYINGGEQHFQVCTETNCANKLYSDHSLVWVSLDATSHRQECNKEGCDYVTQATAHDTQNSHYTDDGNHDENSHWLVCTLCGMKQSSAEHEWDEGVITQDSTVTKEGVRTFTCVHCGATRTEEVGSKVLALVLPLCLGVPVLAGTGVLIWFLVKKRKKNV